VCQISKIKIYKRKKKKKKNHTETEKMYNDRLMGGGARELDVH
jgi:hypothetical protein